MTHIQTKLVKAGMQNLKDFGYPDCNESNILTDLIYSKFFLSMLKENKGASKALDEEIDGLVKLINSAA